jgi:hypothetical protein
MGWLRWICGHLKKRTIVAGARGLVDDTKGQSTVALIRKSEDGWGRDILIGCMHVLTDCKHHTRILRDGADVSLRGKTKVKLPRMGDFFER